MRGAVRALRGVGGNGRIRGGGEGSLSIVEVSKAALKGVEGNRWGSLGGDREEG